jgi:nucleoside-diphosphate-sugar epimerase
MRVLVIGNMGYVGPVAIREMRSRWPDATLIGVDTGYFAHCLTTAGTLPELLLNEQIFADVRAFDPASLPACDAVVYLAAFSNDVLGNLNEGATMDVNYRSAVRIAEAARAAGAGVFVYASSCSVYGFAEDRPRTEASEVNPLTAYARSKIEAERGLELLARDDFRVTCLRFATACGMSERLRLDLVLNDFVAAALTAQRIQILSDGTPWRPLIDVKDMARAIAWAVQRPVSNGGAFVLTNAGSDRWNFRVSELAEVVAGQIPGTEIAINTAAAPDRRTYRVDFTRFRKLAPDHQPLVEVEQSVREILQGLQAIGFSDPDFRHSPYMRIHTLMRLRSAGRLDENLIWRQSGGNENN